MPTDLATYHHSPSAVQKPLEIDIFQKALKRRGETLYFGSPVAVGRGHGPVRTL